MKIFISTLLLAIVVFLNFYELNAAKNQGSSSVSDRLYEVAPSRAGRPRGSKSRRQNGTIKGQFRIKPYYRQPVVVTGPSWGFLKHMGHSIEVWLDDSKGKIIKADYPGNHCPTGLDYQTKNFLVRLATLSGGLQIVEYVNQDGTLMGVKAPRPTTANVMEPNSTQWFIVYLGKYFKVTLNPQNSAVESITLASRNKHEVARGERAEKVDMAGFKFVVIREPPQLDITGAELSKRPAPPISVDNFHDLIS